MASGSKRVIYAAILANIGIALAKFIAAAITSSSAMLSEGIHSLVDTADGALLLVGEHLGARPPDRQHPFGYGREVFFWSFVVAIMIFAVGGGVSIYEGISRIREPEPLKSPAWSFAVLGASFLFEAISFWISWRHFVERKGDVPFLEAVRRSKNPPDFMIVFEDGAALIGIVIAALGIALELWTGLPVFDGGASIAIGVLLTAVAWLLAVETRGLLVGESVSSEIAEGIRHLVEGDEAVERSGDPLTSYIGPETVLLNLAIKFRSNLETGELEKAIDRIEHGIREKFPIVKRVFIAADSLSEAAPGTSAGS